MATAVFGGGCFWCTEAVFRMLKGVSSVEPGYAGGAVINPNYEQVSRGTTGHAEVIRVTYDPTTISYRDLLTVFFGSHDPTTPNRQGNDLGEQYRSVIFYQTPEEKETAHAVAREVDESLRDGTRIVTEIVPLKNFYPAEEYHHEYFQKNSSDRYCQLIIEPKVEKVRKRFFELLKS